MKSSEMEKYVEDMAFRVFGRSRSLAKAGNGCVTCGKDATEFRDDLSRREYQVSHMCQSCQDSVFGE